MTCSRSNRRRKARARRRCWAHRCKHTYPVTPHVRWVWHLIKHGQDDEARASLAHRGNRHNRQYFILRLTLDMIERGFEGIFRHQTRGRGKIHWHHKGRI